MIDPGEDKRARVLIVDDDAQVCRLLERIFSQAGYETAVETTAGGAARRAEQVRPDLVVLDLRMPEPDGWEGLRRIRRVSEAPVICLTDLPCGEAAAHGEATRRALRPGAQESLSRPFDAGELLKQAAARLQERRRAERSAAVRAPCQRPSVSLVIPTLNEAANLPLVLPRLPLEWIDEVILVDGRSTDHTVEVARQLLPSIQVVLERHPGKGAALQAGYMSACGDIIVVMDADGSHDPREIPRFIRALTEGGDFAKGTRFAPGGGTTDMSLYRKLGNRAFVLLTNLLFSSEFTDLCYGYHAFWRYCLQVPDFAQASGFEIDAALYLNALSHRLRIVEVPSFEGYRFLGEGKLRTIPDGWRVLKTILVEWRKGFHHSRREIYIGFRGGQPKDMLVKPGLEGNETWQSNSPETVDRDAIRF